MKEMIFLTNQMGIQGSYLNHLDLQQYLKDHEGYKIKFYCENVNHLFDTVKLSRRNFTFDKGEVRVIKKETVELDATVITDFKTLVVFYKKGLWLICKKLIVIDSVELCYHLKDMKQARYFHDIDLRKVLKHFYADKIMFLMPPSNHELFKKKHPTLSSKPFFKNINVDMIDTIKCENRPGYFYRWDVTDEHQQNILNQFGSETFKYDPGWQLERGRRVPVKYNETEHIFDYQALVYGRRKYLEYQEQFGRLIFEYILLGKTVFFATETHTDDGLTDYLNHFDIKFDGNKITTTNVELRKRMETYVDRPWV